MDFRSGGDTEQYILCKWMKEKNAYSTLSPIAMFVHVNWSVDVDAVFSWAFP
jgi:hypothetical protein